ncbi:MAG: hypothetical protein ACYCT2_04960 [Thermoplasmataceae archaeon]
MKYEFHGIVVQGSIKDESMLDNVAILGQKQGKDWVLIKVGIKGTDIEKFVESVSRGLKIEGGIPYYSHFYSKNKLFVVFPQIIFEVTPNKETWKPVVEYGLSMGIPLEQLDFFPCKLEDETY